jgi:hypothetical protein
MHGSMAGAAIFLVLVMRFGVRTDTIAFAFGGCRWRGCRRLQYKQQSGRQKD